MGAASTTVRDTRAALALAADLASCQTPEDLVEPLGELSRLIGADTVGAGELSWPPAAERVTPLPEVAHPQIFDEEALALWSAHWREHPMVSRQLHGFDPRVLKISDFLSARQWRRRGLYRVYRHLGLRWEIALHLHWEPRRTACVTLHRRRGDFGERERDLLEQLAPHLRAARARALANRRGARQRQLLLRGAEEAGSGIVLLDSEDRIAVATTTARSLLGDWFGAEGGDRLPASVLAWLAHRERVPGPAPLVRRRDGRRLELRLLRDGEERLLALRELRTGPPSASALAAALPLTRRQSEVLALVAAGEADAAIAQRLGISIRTVGHHVEHILARLGVSSRTGAAARAMRVP